jgi:hypothetical protein
VAALALALLSVAGGVLLALVTAAFVVAVVVVPLLLFGRAGLVITAVAVALLGVIMLAGRSVRRAFVAVFGGRSTRELT